MRRIRIDETSEAKGHRYLMLLCDLDEGLVEYIAEDRKQESPDCYDAGLTPKQLDALETVAMDMWWDYIQTTCKQVSEAVEKLFFDPLPRRGPHP